MSDLISRSALLAEYDKHHVGAPGGARKLIEAAPTIDAVPVDKIQFTDLYLDGSEAIAVFKFGNQGITLRKKCDELAPVVHGRWDDSGRYKFPSGEIAVRCSGCGAALNESEYRLYNWNYCPVCGAKMDGDADV